MSKKRLKRPLLKFEIEEAQANSISAAAAARYLDVNILTYKKYAKFYGIYENLLNPTGIGTSKGFAKSQSHSTKLKDIFENKHPKYPLQRLKWRMVARGLANDYCAVCGFDEERITDKSKPLLMVFKDEHGDYTPTNLAVLCYNCCFLTKDAPTVVNRVHIEDSLKNEDPRYNPNRASWADPSNAVSLMPEPENDLSEEEIRQIKEEIDRELGRI